MATQISYDNVQTAVTYIAQCANNVLTVRSFFHNIYDKNCFQAVNGPLQQRTTVLDLDSSRANSFPADYDTDLESVWSDLSIIMFSSDLFIYLFISYFM